MRIWRGNGGARQARPVPHAAPPTNLGTEAKTKPVIWFVVAAIAAFWAAEQLAFDSVYGAKNWKESDSYGQQWQHDAKLWFRRHRI